LLNTTITQSTNFETTIQGMLILCDIADKKINSLEELENSSLHYLKEVKPRIDMHKKIITGYQNWMTLFKQYYK
jgi:glycerol kinase